MYVYIVSSIFKKADGDYKKYSIAYKTVELALEYVVADMEAQYDGAYADMMTDAVKQNVSVRGDYFFRYGTNDHYIMIEKMEVYDEQPKNVDNVVGFGLASETSAKESVEASTEESEMSAVEEEKAPVSEASVEEANVEPEVEADVEPETEVNVEAEVEVDADVEPEVNVNVQPENTSNVNVEPETKENIEEMINESIDNADANASEEMLNIQPDVKSGNITSEMYEENTIGNVATPQPTSISVDSANESDNVSALAAPASYSTTKGGVAKHKTRKNKKNGPRKSKRRTN